MSGERYGPDMTDEELADIERRARVNGNIRPTRALALVAEIRHLRRHVEVLQEKPEMAGACACGFDQPDDICLVHSQPHGVIPDEYLGCAAFAEHGACFCSTGVPGTCAAIPLAVVPDNAPAAHSQEGPVQHG